MRKFIRTPHHKDVLKLRAESCDMSVMVLDLSQTRDDDAQHGAGTTAVPKPLHWSSVLMRAARLGTARPNPLPVAVSFCPAASPPPAFFLPQIKRAKIWLHPGRSPASSVVGRGQRGPVR
ncbi:hypothetical protein KOW79_017278 [Hemibagrus wyckioides]|uniref:Uncharacterized protein n=1 Tax=Hemibagrus wyckioides TaxID=337641 RepID=A0A9D3NAC8_9TELE|nr:hypothetical protein KOW79_017278 [Hemibagrus wyckioides]